MQTITLTEEQAKDIGGRFCKLVAMDKQARRPNIAKRAVVRDLYFGYNNRAVEYPGESNIHFHVMTEKIEGLVPKIISAWWNADPIVNVRRVAEEHREQDTDNNERFLNWAVDVDIPDLYSVSEQWVRNTYVDGVAVVHVYYLHSERNTVVVHPVNKFWRRGEPDFFGNIIPEDRPKEWLEVLTEVFGLSPESMIIPNRALMGADQVDETTYTVAFAENKVMYEDIKVEFHESRYFDEIDVYVFRPITTHSAPVAELCEFEDIIVPYRTECLQTAERVARQFWHTIAKIKSRVANDDWMLDEEEMEGLITHAKGEKYEEDRTTDDERLKRQKDQHVGEQRDQMSAGNETGKLLFYEVYTCDDIDEDGFDEEVIYIINHHLRKCVRAYYLEEQYPHGRRPLIDLHNIRISDRFYSLSYGELLAPINVEVNAVINMVNEAQELINNPIFFYVPSATTVDPQILTGLRPGQGIPIAEKGAYEFPSFPQQPLANLATIDFLLMFADRLTLVPQGVGSSQVRNAPRTARGTLALMSESGIKTDIFITAAQRGAWKELFHQIHALYAHFGPDHKYYYVTGETKPRRISNAELRGRYEYSFSGNSINTNREVMRTIAQVRYNTLIANPLYAQDLNAMRNLTENFLRFFNEGCDKDKLLPSLPGAGGTHPPLPQKTEIQIMKSGVPVEPLPLDNHAQHLSEIEMLETSSAFEMLDPVTVTLLAIHKRGHIQMLQMAASQGMAEPGGTEGNNQPNADLNQLSGGVQ